MKPRSVQLLICCALATAVLGICNPASAADYSVSNNPYQTVNWDTTLRCQSQHHDHAYLPERITALSEAGYCAVTYMNYSGDYRPLDLGTWQEAGSPDPDPGIPTGWVGYRRWPPEDFGAPALPLNTLRFYLPGAEEIGLVGGTPGSPTHTVHMYALGLMTYMEGVGCASCGNNGSAVHNDNPFGLPESQRYSSSSDFVAKATALGALVTLNHPVGSPSKWDSLNPYPMSIEMFNNYYKTNDEGTCGTSYSGQFMAAWDHVLQTKSARIWGVASNDWNSAWLSEHPPSCWPPIDTKNRDRGKMQVLLTSYDLAAYMDAFRVGAFFAIVEDNEFKAAYPTVTNIAVAPSQVTITTAAGTETVTWIGNGTAVGSGSTLLLTNLPSGLKYVRAEIDDGQGRTVYTQPFELGDPIPPPPPPAPDVPALPVRTLALLALLLLVTVNRMASRSAARSNRSA